MKAVQRLLWTARWSLALACSSAAMLLAAYWWHLAVAEDRDAALRDLADTEMNVRQLRAERAVVDGLIVRFEHEQAEGTFAAEDRLLWVAALERVVDSQRVLAATYSLFPQKAASNAPPIRLWQLRQTPIRLQLSLVHEADALGLLQVLAQEVGGALQVDACELNRTQPGTEPLAGRENFTAVCDLSWLTVRRSSSGNVAT